MANEQRGEITKKLGGLEITVVPTFARISRAEAALGQSCLTIASSMAQGQGLTTLEMAVFIEALSKPRLKRDAIGEAIIKAGSAKAMEIVGLVCERILVGDDPDPDDDDDDDDDLKLPGEKKLNKGK